MSSHLSQNCSKSLKFFFVVKVVLFSALFIFLKISLKISLEKVW